MLRSLVQGEVNMIWSQTWKSIILVLDQKTDGAANMRDKMKYDRENSSHKEWRVKSKETEKFGLEMCRLKHNTFRMVR